MSLHITLDSKIRDTFRVQQVVGMFDLPTDRVGRLDLDVELPAAGDPWIIGAIVGPSGSGKTTVARAAFGSPLRRPRWPKQRAVIDALGRDSLRGTLGLLAAVGLNSSPAWLRPYHVLSTGEKFRCELARWLASCSHAPRAGGHWRCERTTLVVDEFTSHLDRDTARSVSYALGRFLRRSTAAEPNQNPNQHANQHPSQHPIQTPNQLALVAVTCHEDFLPWLAPDWVLRLPEGALDRGPFAAPPLPLSFQRCHRRLWDCFRPHHYLSTNLARGATCYAATWDGRPAAFCALLGQIGHPGRKRITRLVTLPQFQGLGIGMRLAEYVCSLETTRGFRVSIATSHPAVIDVCRRSPRWKYLGIKRLGGTPQRIGTRRLAGSAGRIVAAFEYRRE